jgi:uncharacterized membrane protein YjjP (DUF1212 family)
MSNDIRLTRLKLEAIEIDSRFDAETRKIFSEFKLNESQLNEGIIDTIKEKVSQMFGVAQKNPEALKAKTDNMEQQLRAQGKDKELDAVNSFMERLQRNLSTSFNEFPLWLMIAIKAAVFGVLFGLGAGAGAAVFVAALSAPALLQAIVQLVKTMLGAGRKEPS